jgi:K+-sensing histidine kinase KdpD
MSRLAETWGALPTRTRLSVSWIAAIAVPIGLAAALIPIRGNSPSVKVALILALAVAVLAMTGNRATAAAAAVSAGLGFDLFHTRPYYSPAINRLQDVETTALLLAVGLVVGQLAARNRLNRSRAAASSYDLGRLHGVAEMVAAGVPAADVVDAVTQELRDLLQLRDCWFDPQLSAEPGPFIERHGAVTWGVLEWGYGTMGLPAHDISLVLQHQGMPVGRFVLVPQPGTPVTTDELIAAVALGDQAAAALAAQGTHH